MAGFPLLWDDPGKWQVFASGQAEGRVLPAGDGMLRLEYDFHGGNGFVVIRRALQLRMPDTFELRFQLHGHGPYNHFEVKVAADGGVNVWRHLRKDFAPFESWQDIRITERGIPFAWGPAGGGSPGEIEAIEIAVIAGPGGRGFLEFRDAELFDQSLRESPDVSASSACPGQEAAAALRDGTHGWRAQPDDTAPWWAVDFGHALRFGGLVLNWPDGLPPRAFRVEASDDGAHWSTLYQATRAGGRLSHIATPGAETRYLRISFTEAASAALLRAMIRPDAFSATPNEFMHAVASDYPRSWHPRPWHREQSYWTPVGAPCGKRRALINEEGMVETDEAGFSFEPFLVSRNKLIGWSDVRTSVASERGGLPMPSVIWKARGLKLDIMPWVDGDEDHLTLHVEYRLRATSKHRGTTLAVAIRPFQVNPPWQAFRNLGGVSPIRHITCHGGGAEIDGKMVIANPPPEAAAAAMFEEGSIPAFLASGKIPTSLEVNDPAELASAVMTWALPPDQSELTVTLSFAYFSGEPSPSPCGRSAARRDWSQCLSRVKWNVPPCAQPAIDCLRAAAGHILINRDGPAIQPGPRRYTRSWIRDCVVMGSALSKVGLHDPLRLFLEWYAPFQRDDGFIPCVVDRDGIDWLVEHDSHGQFLWGLREVWRSGGKASFPRMFLARIRKTAEYIIELRRQRMTDEFKSGGDAERFGLMPASQSLEDEDTLDTRREFFGLLPESASHEGYLAHPVHSYWDDFWGIRGLHAAADLAEACGHSGEASRWREEARSFETDTIASMRLVVAQKNLDYLPGSVEWADFDPTATANAIGLLDFADELPAEPLRATIDKYLDGFHRKHDGNMPWTNYTAYEIRIIGALIRLGHRDTANQLLTFFLSDRRPSEWNQWPEITWRDPRSPGHLGDVPHTWIAAEYILAVSSMVASEREGTNCLVLASGLDWSWIAEGRGFSVKRLPTRFGKLDFHICATSDSIIEVAIGGKLKLPAGGLKLAPPLPADLRIAAVEGDAASIGDDEVTVWIGECPFAAKLHLASREPNAPL